MHRHNDQPEALGSASHAAGSMWNSPTPNHASDHDLARDVETLLREVDLLQSRLTETGAQVERMQRLAMLGELSGFIAHEFNNLLTPLLARAQLALRSPRDPDEMAAALERTVATIKKATTVADSILGLAQQSPGIASMPGSDVSRGTRDVGADQVNGGGDKPVADLAACVRAAISTLAINRRAPDAAITAEIPEGLAVSIPPTELEQVILNLLLNATKAHTQAARRGNCRIHISANLASHDTQPDASKCSHFDRITPRFTSGPHSVSGFCTGWVAVLSIHDQAGGIPEPVLQGLAQRGIRVRSGGAAEVQDECHANGESSRASESERVCLDTHAAAGDDVAADATPRGSGLGLEICRRIVERAGGWIEIESRPGDGATVTAVLPAAAASTSRSGTNPGHDHVGQQAA